MKKEDLDWQLQVLEFEYNQKLEDAKQKYSHEVKCQGHGEFYSDYTYASALIHQDYLKEKRKLLNLPEEEPKYEEANLPLIKRPFPNLK